MEEGIPSFIIFLSIFISIYSVPKKTYTHRKLGVIIIIIFWNITWKKARMPTCLNQGRGRG
jgi:hypothetical protein